MAPLDQALKSAADNEPVRVCSECAHGLSVEHPAVFPFRLNDGQRAQEQMWLSLTQSTCYAPGRAHHHKLIHEARAARALQQRRRQHRAGTGGGHRGDVDDGHRTAVDDELWRLAEPPQTTPNQQERALLRGLRDGLGPSLRPFVWPMLSGADQLRAACPRELYASLLAVDLDKMPPTEGNRAGDPEHRRTVERFAGSTYSSPPSTPTKPVSVDSGRASAETGGGGHNETPPPPPPSSSSLSNGLVLSTPPATPARQLPSPFSRSPARPNNGFAPQGPPTLLDTIRADVGRTLPAHAAFRDQDGGGQAAMLHLLRAFAAFHGSVGYAQGMSYVAAVVLLNAPDEETGFWMFVCLMRLPAYGLSGLFSRGTPTLGFWLAHFADTLQRTDAELSAHFDSAAVFPETFAQRWFKTCFVYDLRLPLVFRIWDVFLTEGPDVFIKCALAILLLLKPKLLQLNGPELLSFLKDSQNLAQINADDLMELVFSSANDEDSSKQKEDTFF